MNVEFIKRFSDEASVSSSETEVTARGLWAPCRGVPPMGPSGLQDEDEEYYTFFLYKFRKC